MLTQLHPATELDTLELPTFDDTPVIAPIKVKGHYPLPEHRARIRAERRIAKNSSSARGDRTRDMNNRERSSSLIVAAADSAALSWLNTTEHRTNRTHPTREEVYSFLTEWVNREGWEEDPRCTGQVSVMGEYDAITSGGSKGQVTDLEKIVMDATEFVLEKWNPTHNDKYSVMGRKGGLRTKWDIGHWIDTIDMTQVQAAEVLAITRQTVANMRKYFEAMDAEELAERIEAFEKARGNRNGRGTDAGHACGPSDDSQGSTAGGAIEASEEAQQTGVAVNDGRGGDSASVDAVHPGTGRDGGELVGARDVEGTPAWLVSADDIAHYLTDQGHSTNTGEPISGSSDENDTHFLETEPASEVDEASFEDVIEDILKGRARPVESKKVPMFDLPVMHGSFAFAEVPEGWDA